MKALAVFLTIFMLLTGCSVSKKQETREYQLESKRCGQTYFQCTNTCGSKKLDLNYVMQNVLINKINV
jgi:hypothetical protein